MTKNGSTMYQSFFIINFNNFLSQMPIRTALRHKKRQLENASDILTQNLSSSSVDDTGISAERFEGIKMYT